MESNPTAEDYKKFQRHLDSLSDREIADLRYQGEWGNYDPNDSTKSSWKVRQANRELTARKTRRERRLQWIAIFAAFLTGWIAIGVAALAIPLDKGRSVYCLIDPFNICS
jgi:hypothetical protein